MTLRDAATVWADIADLPARYANALYELAAGRDMFNSQGYDFTGTWPVLTTLSSELAPAGLSPKQVASFEDRMTVSVKGGSYDVADCTSGPSCEATWWVFAGNVEIPSCSCLLVTETDYTWGYYVNDSIGAFNSDTDDTVGGRAFFNAQGQVLAAPISEALSGWAACAPTVTPTLVVKKEKLASSQTVDNPHDALRQRHRPDRYRRGSQRNHQFGGWFLFVTHSQRRSRLVSGARLA